VTTIEDRVRAAYTSSRPFRLVTEAALCLTSLADEVLESRPLPGEAALSTGRAEA